MSEAIAKVRHPVEVLQAFRYRIRPYDALGVLLENSSRSAFNPEDIGLGLIALVEDFEAACAEVQAWFDADRKERAA